MMRRSFAGELTHSLQLATDLKTVATLTTDATNGQYIWTPAGSLVNGNDYALQITQGSQLNYFGPCKLRHEHSDVRTLVNNA